MTHAMDLAILIGAGLIAISIATSLVSFRFGAPLLLVFLGIGLLAGENGPGGIRFNDAGTAYFVGSTALAIILFDSGFETRTSSYRLAAWPSVVLASIGVAITAALVAVAAHLLFDLPWVYALLLGAIVSPTDAAAVFFGLRVGGVTLRERVKATLEIESGTNDPMAIFLTSTMVEIAISGSALADTSWLAAMGSFLTQLGVGMLGGLIGGYAVGFVIRRLRLEPALQPIAVLSLALVVFAAATLLGGSGFLAVYVAGLIAGNLGLKAAPRLRRFQSGMTWLAQMAMFLTLGLLATPAQFGEVALPAVALALVLLFVARPVAVWLCLLPFGFTRNEITFVAWVGLRGAVSILLATLPMLGGLARGSLFFDVVFIMVLVSLTMQGWTMRPAARWLGLIVPPRRGPVDRVELELPDDADQELVAYSVHKDSAVLAGERLPRWARPALIIRSGQAYTIHTAGPLRAGDHVYLFTSPRRIELLDRLFAGKADVEDRDFYGDFSLPASALLGDIAEAYELQIPENRRGLKVGDALAREYGGRVEVGDRMIVGGVELIARAVSDNGQVREIGLAVAPTIQTSHRLPLFPSGREILERLKRRFRGKGGTKSS